MEKYKVEIKKSASKEIEHLDKRTVQAVMHKIHDLAENPRPQGCEKLSSQDKYRIRCGDYRILYTIEDCIYIVCIIKVKHRRDVYRN